MIQADFIIEDESNYETVKTCFICHSTDHLARDCPKRGEDDEQVCYVCHKPGHKASECRYNRYFYFVFVTLVGTKADPINLASLFSGMF